MRMRSWDSACLRARSQRTISCGWSFRILDGALVSVLERGENVFRYWFAVGDECRYFLHPFVGLVQENIRFRAVVKGEPDVNVFSEEFDGVERFVGKGVLGGEGGGTTRRSNRQEEGEYDGDGAEPAVAHVERGGTPLAGPEVGGALAHCAPGSSLSPGTGWWGGCAADSFGECQEGLQARGVAGVAGQARFDGLALLNGSEALIQNGAEAAEAHARRPPGRAPGEARGGPGAGET